MCKELLAVSAVHSALLLWHWREQTLCLQGEDRLRADLMHTLLYIRGRASEAVPSFSSLYM